MADIPEHPEDGVRKICNDYDNRPDALLEILHDIQRQFGYLSEDSLRTTATALNISRAEIHGVVSFYHDFRREPAASQVIKICRAEACQAQGAKALIAQAEADFGARLNKPSGKVALESAYCLGNCALGPAVMIEDNLYGRVDPARLRKLSKQLLGEGQR